MNYNLYQNDVVAQAKATPDNTYDAIYCDPPYGLGRDPNMADLLTHWLNDEEYDTGGGFMGKDWDIVPGPAVWRELLRVAKPGAHLLAFGGTRTADLLSIAVRLAGWQRFDELMWVYSSGYPKSHDISRAIDRSAGAQREVMTEGADGKGNQTVNAYGNGLNVGFQQRPVTLPATEDAAAWSGYGTALKPAYEPILCFRKPISGTYADNALAWGCGGLNIDGCRVGDEEVETKGQRKKTGNTFMREYQTPEGWTGGKRSGRWPANVLHDGSDEVVDLFPQTKPSKAGRRGAGINGATFKAPAYEPTTRGHNDKGGSAARFFYCAKASKTERNAGLDDLPERATHRYGAGIGEGLDPDAPAMDRNHHPCVKPLRLNEYLCRLILPPEAYRPTARILIPFAGSGSEVVGALIAGWQNVDGIEQDPEYIQIAHRRIAYWLEYQRGLPVQASLLEA